GQLELARGGGIEMRAPGQVPRRPARVPDRGGVIHGHLHRSDRDHDHLAMVPVFPRPTPESMANSFTRRRAPPSPRPSLPPVVNPSCSALSTSGMPGPWSAKTRRRPFLTPFSRSSSRTEPPPPYTTA